MVGPFRYTLTIRRSHKTMIQRNLDRRLKRIEERMMLRQPKVLRILVTRVGMPDRTLELVVNAPRRRYWQRSGE
jgi:hypothetical protein